jgi:hypothetical protein
MKQWAKVRLDFLHDIMVIHWWNDLNILGKLVLWPFWLLFGIVLFVLTSFIKL